MNRKGRACFERGFATSICSRHRIKYWPEGAGGARRWKIYSPNPLQSLLTSTWPPTAGPEGCPIPFDPVRAGAIDQSTQSLYEGTKPFQYDRRLHEEIALPDTLRLELATFMQSGTGFREVSGGILELVWGVG